MPALTPKDRINMLGYLPDSCRTCGEPVYKDYCRQCDEFLFICGAHCPQNSVEHNGHRRYPKEERNIGETEETRMLRVLGMLVDVHSQEPDPHDKRTVEELLGLGDSYSLRSIFYALYNIGRQRGRQDSLK